MIAHTQGRAGQDKERQCASPIFLLLVGAYPTWEKGTRRSRFPNARSVGARTLWCCVRMACVGWGGHD